MVVGGSGPADVGPFLNGPSRLSTCQPHTHRSQLLPDPSGLKHLSKLHVLSWSSQKLTFSMGCSAALGTQSASQKSRVEMLFVLTFFFLF